MLFLFKSFPCIFTLFSFIFFMANPVVMICEFNLILIMEGQCEPVGGASQARGELSWRSKLTSTIALPGCLLGGSMTLVTRLLQLARSRMRQHNRTHNQAQPAMPVHSSRYKQPESFSFRLRVPRVLGFEHESYRRSCTKFHLVSGESGISQSLQHGVHRESSKPDW